MPLAVPIGERSPGYFFLACSILSNDAVGVLLPEFVACLHLLESEAPSALVELSLTPLTCWLQSLDIFNKLAPGHQIEETEEMFWPGCGAPSHHSIYNEMDVPTIRQADFENHNIDGGNWVVHKGRVYDLQDFATRIAADEAGNETDIQKAFEDRVNACENTELIRSCLVGNFEMPELDDYEGVIPELTSYSSPFMELERNLATVLGLFSLSLYRSSALQSVEIDSVSLIQSAFLKAGLKELPKLDPFNENKEDGPGLTSQPPTPISSPTDLQPLEQSTESEGQTVKYLSS